MKILAFAASSSRNSINKQLAVHAAGLIEDAEVEILDLNDYEMPLYSQDREAESGTPDAAGSFLAKIAGCDALIVSYAEHNGTYTAAYKNVFDWCSRIEKRIFQDKPMVILSTSPGELGARFVLAAATAAAPRFGAEVKAQLSIPSFHENFDGKTGRITNPDLEEKLLEAVRSLL